MNLRVFPARIACAVILFLMAVAAILFARALHVQPQGAAPKGALAMGKELRCHAGPVRLTIGINKPDITVADILVLVIRADAPDNCLVEMPRLDRRLGSFEVVGQYDGPLRLTRRRISSTRVYRLQPSLAGPYTIPAFRIPFYCVPDESNPAPSNTEGIIRTGEVPIMVHSLLTGAAESSPGDILAPLAPAPLNRRWQAAAAAIFAFVSATALLAFIRLRTRRRISGSVEPQAHEIARAAIRGLLDHGLSANYAPERFFRTLQDTLCVYVQRRFDLGAQQTTSQELLGAVGALSCLQPRSMAFLRDFMDVCDRVKFALYHPDQAEAGRIALDCAAFIDDAEAQSDDNEI